MKRSAAPALALDRAELAERAEVAPFIVDLVIGAGLVTPVTHPDGERFAAGAVDMLVAARTLVSEGLAIEELTALAMRHATHVESVIEDAIDLFKRRTDRRGGDRSELSATLPRLVPVVTDLVAQHFEKTLMARALDRLGDDAGTVATAIVVGARRLDERVDPLAAYAAARDLDRSLWIRPDRGLQIAAMGAVEVIEPTGSDRFSGASAARATLAARVRRHGPADAPAPVLIGGFSFRPGPDHRSPSWPGFGDCRLVLPELTVIDRPDGTWVQIAARVGSDGDEPATLADLDRRLAAFGVPVLQVDEAETCHHGDETDEAGYLNLVSRGIDAIDGTNLEKVVCARVLTIEAEPDPVAMLARLREQNPTCAVFAFTLGPASFFGATPEELVTLDGHRLRTSALAGTAPRGATEARDQALAAELQASAKNRAEHRFVVDAITAALEGIGLVDPTPAEPDVLLLTSLQHLRTPITARVEKRSDGVGDMDVLRVAGVLHPTPATGGTPRGAALAFIADNEPFDRGWYAGPVGWCDLDGNGELGVALRSVLAVDGRLHLFAGAGVVAGSVPDEELAETAVKFRALLDVMG